MVGRDVMKNRPLSTKNMPKVKQQSQKITQLHVLHGN